MKTKYTKKQITEAIAHWQKVLESMNERDGSNVDEYGFQPDETDVWIFDIFDETGKCRNGNYDKYRFRSTSKTTEQDIKHVLDKMTKSWSNRALKNAKKEAKKNHEIFRSANLPYYSFHSENIQHLTKEEFIKTDVGELRFFDLDDEIAKLNR